MSDQIWDRLSELYAEALALTAEDRAAFLEKIDAEDSALRQELESLLAHSDSVPEDFLSLSQTGSIADSGPNPFGAMFWIGKRIGNYHIKSLIATGGMGSVFEAVQDQPHRVVALKVMRSDLNSPSAARRFKFESQILGRLRHPNIAQVYEAGLHVQDHVKIPFFAMEYIPGAKTITQYAAERKLSPGQKITLFAKACDAIAHGHQNAVFHRDIKPANILVDNNGEPKVIDFGVARATDSDLTLTMQQTHVGQIVGTLQYMSPEQCDGDPHALDTRSDVYSLGIVLYELLTEQLPYQPPSSSISAASKTIREAKPSRLSTINPRLRGDIETVVLKAIEKDRDRRYRSASEFADDLRRVISDEPVLARPPNAAYLALKFLQRRKWQSIALILVVASGLTTWVASKFYVAQQRAAVNELRAIQAAYGARVESAYTSAQFGHPSASFELPKELRIENRRPWELRLVDRFADQSIDTIQRRTTRSNFRAADNPRLDMFVYYDCSPAPSLVVLPLDCAEDIPTCPRIQPIPIAGARGIGAAAVSPDGHWISTCIQTERQTRPYVIRVFRRREDRIEPCQDLDIESSNNSSPSCNAMHFTENPSCLLAGDENGVVHLWKLNPSELSPFSTHPDWMIPAPDSMSSDENTSVIDLAVDRSQRWLAVMRSARGVIDLYDLNVLVSASSDSSSAVHVATLRGHTYHGQRCAFLESDGRLRLVSTAIDKRVIIWDIDKAISQSKGPSGPLVPDQSYELLALGGHRSGVRTVDILEGGRRFLTGSDDHMIRVWEVREDIPALPGSSGSGTLPIRLVKDSELHGNSDNVVAVKALPNGSAISLTYDGTIKAWWPDSPDVPRLTGHLTSVFAVATSPDADGQYLASGDGNGVIIIWDQKRGVPEGKLTVAGGVKALSWWNDPRINGSSWLAVAVSNTSPRFTQSQGLSIYDLRDPSRPKLVTQVRDVPNSGVELTSGMRSLAISRDRRRLAAGCRDGAVLGWALGEIPDLSGRPRFLGGCKGAVTGLAFLDAAGRWLASSSGWDAEANQDPIDVGIRVWDTESGASGKPEPKLTFAQDEKCTVSLATSSDGNYLASGAVDGGIILWGVEQNSGLPQMHRIERLDGHSGPVNALAFHPHEDRLASASSDYMVKVWSLNPAANLLTLRGPLGGLFSLTFDSSGESLAAASAGSQGLDNVVWLWSTEKPPDRINRAKAMRVYDECRYWWRDLGEKSDDEILRRLDELETRLPWLKSECGRARTSLAVYRDQ